MTKVYCVVAWYDYYPSVDNARKCFFNLKDAKKYLDIITVGGECDHYDILEYIVE